MKPPNELINRSEYWRKLFDTVPLPMLVVDRDVRVLEVNRAADALLGRGGKVLLRKKGGEVLRCVHSGHEGGCGHGEGCAECVIWHAVGNARKGEAVTRQRAVLEKIDRGEVRTLEFLITSSAFEENDEPRVLLVMEDVTELMALRGLVPICSNCKNIRDDKHYWHRLEAYCQDYLSLNFTHSICPECARKLYGNGCG